MKYEKVPNDSKDYKRFITEVNNTKLFNSILDFYQFLLISISNLGFTNASTAYDYQNYMKKIVYLIYSDSHRNLKNESIFSFEKKLKLFRNDSRFKNYNINENRFPNAAINYYFIYLSSLFTEVDENFEKILQENDEPTIVQESSPESHISYYINGHPIYKRNQKFKNNALEKALWTCEINNDHKSFLTEDSRDYVEGHHLVPLGFQVFFSNSLDFTDNIISLCPTCHRRIHYGTKSDKKKMIKVLYKERHLLLKSKGIDISLSDLLFMYSVD